MTDFAPLPPHIDPMLAKIGKAFDADDHLFEVKWDGTRAITFVEGNGVRGHNRRRREVIPRYPELDALRAAEPGLVLDGELVILGADGRPEFRGMFQREQARQEARVRRLAATKPATYVVFDVLYRRGASLMGAPLSERRKHLVEVVAKLGDPRVIVSEGVVGAGLAFFEQIRRMEIEGMVAKDLASSYRPGARSEAWLKVKPIKHMQCVVIGYQLREDAALKSLIIAAPLDGTLTCVGRVGSGITEEMSKRLLAALVMRPRATSLVECGTDGHFVEPAIYCTVSYLEQNDSGTLRAPVFVGVIEGG